MKKQKIDVTIDDSGEYAKSPVYYAIQCVELIKSKVEVLPNLKPLTLLLKKLISNNLLNNSFFGTSYVIKSIGGLCSYGLILMISAYLNMVPYSPSVAHSFLEVLRFYGAEFDNKTMLIVNGDYIVHVDSRQEFLDGNAVVYDPLRSGVNVAMNVTKFQEIKECFLTAYNKLLQLKAEYSPDRNVKILDFVLNSSPIK